MLLVPTKSELGFFWGGGRREGVGGLHNHCPSWIDTAGKIVAHGVFMPIDFVVASQSISTSKQIGSMQDIDFIE
jgi:hypothetical protein